MMLKERLETIYAKINESALKGGHNPEGIKLVAVTKNVSTELIKEAFDLGITDLGENRLQEAMPKIAHLPESIKWHFIGYLQTNKVREVLNSFFLIHSLDRLNLANSLENRAQKLDINVPVLVQVNTSGEISKYGIAPEELEDFLIEIKSLSRIKVKGLMTMAPFTDNPEETRPFFRRLRLLKEQFKIPGVEMKYLSMGMSNDYHVAVEEGANIIRVGNALFGHRNKK